MYSTRKRRIYSRKFVATAGVFDGIHNGHKFILKKVISEADRQKALPLVITFWPHPEYILKKNFPGHIMNLSRKKNTLLKLGIDNIWVLNTTKALLNMDGFSFMNIITAKFSIKEMVVGEDFKFGYKSMWGIDKLRDIGGVLGFNLSVVRKIKYNRMIISSSLIRSLVRDGDFLTAKSLMDRDYIFEGKVIKGKGLGTKMGFPTINIENVDNLVLPKNGVYAVLVYYGKRTYLGAANIGFKPTVQPEKKHSVEVHIFNFDKNILGRTIRVVFLEKVRKERKFSSVSTLAARIKKDLSFISSKYSSYPYI
ncbi:MAG: riboflavin biosynthesis protein RibF [Candidatus Omnitrophica bacterium 4484_171]|nr:MAG: riboflavin biosynthesis protein RibF [Candidatus Omnitrophica bacterium 4484_171]